MGIFTCTVDIFRFGCDTKSRRFVDKSNDVRFSRRVIPGKVSLTSLLCRPEKLRETPNVALRFSVVRSS